MSGEYTQPLNALRTVFMHVKFTTDRRDVVDCAIVLLGEEKGEVVAVRLYDGAHGENEMHRYTRSGGKEPAEIFSRDGLGPGMRAAIEEIKRGYGAMIESWRKH